MKILPSFKASYLLIAILVVAAILRFNHITQPFTDYIDWRQTSTAMMAENFYRRNWNIFYPEISWDGPGPSYNGREFQTISYISAILYLFVGQHDWIGRSVAVVFGLWGIFALYQLVSRIWNREYALASAAVMALLPGSIFVERSFIPDPAMVSLVVTGFWILVVYLQTHRLQYLLLASTISCWGFLTKITGLIVGIPMLYTMFSILSFERRLDKKNLTDISLAAIFTLIPVIAYYLWAKHLSLTYPPYHFAGSGNWLWDSGIHQWWEQKYFLHKLFWNFDSWIWTKPVMFLVLVGLCLRPPHQHQCQAQWVFHWWMLVGIIYYLIGAKELVINSWNFHILNPAAAALAGRTIISIKLLVQRVFSSPVSWATVVAILLLIGGVGQKHLKNMYNPSWDSTTTYRLGLALRHISKPDDLVVTIPSATTEPIAIYYSQRRGWSFPPSWPEVGWWGDIIPDDKEAIRLFEKLRDRGADWFGIANIRKQKLWKNNPKFAKYIESTCELKQANPDWAIYRILPRKEVTKF